ncbi:unnamed protein product [Owenia fusiformis]|uniref:Uncharacterized protein n=1 Tax=Owenia fusiformis TaxID=6347 RepID=A0A8J1TVB4_OWEFU|nr:unnamed protein product [Owenia fusiformis]
MSTANVTSESTPTSSPNATSVTTLTFGSSDVTTSQANDTSATIPVTTDEISTLNVQESTQNPTGVTTTPVGNSSANTVTVNILFEMTFKTGVYDNPNNTETIALNKTLTNMFFNIYNRVRGITLASVLIIELYDGSLGVKHDVTYDSTLDTESKSNIALELISSIEQGGGSLTDSDGGAYVVKGDPTVEQNGKQVAISTVCSIYESESACQNRGVCVEEDNSPTCSCNFMYAGRYCADLNIQALLAVVLGTIGGIFFLVIIILIVILCKKRLRNKETNKSGSEDSVSDRDWKSFGYGVYNRSLTDIPYKDFKNVPVGNTSDYSVYTNDTYRMRRQNVDYPPDVGASNSETPWYQKVNTDMNFKIDRPKVEPHAREVPPKRHSDNNSNPYQTNTNVDSHYPPKNNYNEYSPEYDM